MLNYSEQLLESTSLQDRALNYSQLPEFLKESKLIKSKMNRRTQQQLSDWRIVKNINDTLRELQKEGTEEAYFQRVMIVAASSCPRYGAPSVEETRLVIEAAKVMRRKLFTGEEKTLKIDPKKPWEIFPPDFIVWQRTHGSTSQRYQSLANT